MSDESEDLFSEQNDVGIIDELRFKSSTVDINEDFDLIYSETDVNSKDPLKHERTNAQNDKKINIPKLLKQLLNAKVVLERLPISICAQKFRFTEETIAEQVNEDATSSALLIQDVDIESSVQSHAADIDEIVNEYPDKNHLKSFHKIKRYCPKCKAVVTGTGNKTVRPCTKCKSPLDFKCAQCDKTYSNYYSMLYHLKAKCDVQIFDFTCTKCSYHTQSKILMGKHKRYCTRKNQM